MILTQYNMIKAYNSEEVRHWNRTGNREEPILYVTTKTPAMQLITDNSNAATGYIVSQCSGADVDTFAITLESEDNYYRLIYKGEAFTLDDGFYYYRVEQGGDTYYFDTFFRTSDQDLIDRDLVKITVNSSNVERGKKTRYTLNMTDFTFEGYFKCFEYNGIEPDKEEDAEEDDGVVDPFYTSSSSSRRWVVLGTEPIWEFLLGVRILQMNGSVVVWYKGVDYDGSDFMAEISEDFGGGDLVNVEIAIKPDNEVMRVINTIN